MRTHQRACAIELGFNACTCILFHATADGSPFGAALCGYKPEGDEGIWVTQIRADLNCAVCLDLSGGDA